MRKRWGRMAKEKKVLGREHWGDKGKVCREVPLPYSICALRAFISGSEKSFYPLLSRPGSGAPKGWPMILPGVGGGSRFPVWPSLPHLCQLSLDYSSDSVCLLSSGRTVIGSAARDISLQGPGLAPEHCYIENLRGALTLYPCGNACTIDGLLVRQPTRLTQGKF